MSFYLGIDLGTSGCRAVAIDREGAMRAFARVDLPAPEGGGDRAQQEPGLWWTAVLEVLARVLRRVPAHEIAAIAVDGTSATTLLTDGKGQPLGPALMYNDGRAQEQARRIAAVAPRDSAVHGATSGLAKLLYLLPRHPAARHALHQADWIAGNLCGRFDVCDENNALKMGYDPVRREWPGWLDTLDVPRALLPMPVTPGTPIGTVKTRVASHLGLGSGIRIVAGTTDSIAGVIATGASLPGEAVTSLGSTLVLKVLSPGPVFAPEYGIYSHRLGNRWLAGGASNTGGAVLLAHFRAEQLAHMTPLLNPARRTGLDYYPLVRPGERFPIHDPNLAPRLAPRPAEDVRFFQGMLESMARIEQQGYALLADLGAPYPTSVRTVGGGSTNPAWTRLREQALGVPVTTAPNQEAAYGAALLARQGSLR